MKIIRSLLDLCVPTLRIMDSSQIQTSPSKSYPEDKRRFILSQQYNSNISLFLVLVLTPIRFFLFQLVRGLAKKDLIFLKTIHDSLLLTSEVYCQGAPPHRASLGLTRRAFACPSG